MLSSRVSASLLLPRLTPPPAHNPWAHQPPETCAQALLLTPCPTVILLRLEGAIDAVELPGGDSGVTKPGR